MATFARITRTALLDELTKDYVRTARARGVRTMRLLFRHIARNASIPVITVSALEISNLLAGAVIVETVFAWPGLGQVTVQSILARDFLIVQGVVLLGAFVTVALNLAADILYSIVDPRIRLEAAQMTVLVVSTPAIRRRRTREWLRWWPVALIALFVLAAILRAADRALRSEQPEPDRPAQAAGHDIARIPLSPRQR